MTRVERLAALVAEVEADPPSFGVRSTGERIAVVLGRIDWLKADGCHSLEAARDRLGDDWWRATKAVIEMRRRTGPATGE